MGHQSESLPTIVSYTVVSTALKMQNSPKTWDPPRMGEGLANGIPPQKIWGTVLVNYQKVISLHSKVISLRPSM